MRLSAWLSLALLSSFIFSPRAQAGDPPPFAWKDGDRVALIGDALIERDQKSGYFETLVTIRNPDKTITFRNLGWSGDTVYGVARAGFGKPQDGFKHLVDHVLTLKPTVLIVGYGMTDSFDGEAGLPRFASVLNGLLDALNGLQARVVLLSPIKHEDLGRPLPNPLGHNKNLELYGKAIREVANRRGAWFVDLFDMIDRWQAAIGAGAIASAQHLTDDGIHLNERGAWLFADAVSRILGQESPDAIVLGNFDKIKLSGMPPSGPLKMSGGSPIIVRLEMIYKSFPMVPFPVDPARSDGKSWPVPHRLAFGGLADGRYVLSIDGRTVGRGDAEEWAKSAVKCSPGPEAEQVEKLRQAINEKNRLYFYRWRPQNETYLFGFRKHEQGNNAREIPLFDPLVEEKEREIATLKVPTAHVYELVREGEAAR